MRKKDRYKNIGRFVETKAGIVYVDRQEKVWTENNISDLVATFRNYSQVLKFLEHYKKYLDL